MKKALIFSVLIGGMCGNSLSPMVVQSVAAAPIPTTPPTLEVPPAKIQLLTPGTKPLRELKFRPAANSKQTMTVTMGMSADTSMGDSPMTKMPIPKMVMKMDLNVRQVDPNGDIHYSFAYSDIKAIADKDTPPEMVAAFQNSLKNLMGIQGDMVISSSGQVKSKNLILPKTVEPMIRQTLERFNKSMEQFSIQLPIGMVGLGAKWQINNSLQASGIKLNQSSTYEIVEINDLGMTVQTKMIQSSSPQELRLPGAGKDVKAKLTSLTSNGEGKYLIQFDSLLPISGKLSVNTDSKILIQSDPKDQPTSIVNKMAIDLNISDR